MKRNNDPHEASEKGEPPETLRRGMTDTMIDAMQRGKKGARAPQKPRAKGLHR